MARGVETDRLKKEQLSHQDLIRELLAFDDYLARSERLFSPARMDIFSRMAVTPKAQEAYRKMIKRVREGEGPDKSIEIENLWLPYPAILVGSRTDRLWVNQGVGVARGLVRIDLPIGGVWDMAIDKDIYHLGANGVAGLLSFLGVDKPMVEQWAVNLLKSMADGQPRGLTQIKWFPDHESFVIFYMKEGWGISGEVERCDYCMDLGHGYWGRRSDVSREHFVPIFYVVKGNMKRIAYNI